MDFPEYCVWFVRHHPIAAIGIFAFCYWAIHHGHEYIGCGFPRRWR